MAVIYVTGWEAGSTAWYTTAQMPWSFVNGEYTNNAARQHRTASGAGGNYSIRPGWSLTSGALLPTTSRWLHFWGQPNIAGSTTCNCIFSFNYGGQVTVIFASTGTITIDRGNTNITTEVSAFNPNVSHWFAVYCVAQDAPTGACEVYVDGVMVASVPAGTDMQQGASPDWNQVAFGNLFGPIGTTNAAACEWWIDDVIITDAATGRVNEHFIPVLSPTSDASPLTLIPSTGVTQYDLIDEIPVSTTDYDYADTIGQQSFFGMSNLSVTATSILCINAMAEVFREGSITMGEAAVESGGTTTYQTPIVLPSGSYYGIQFLQETDPDTGVGWDTAGINAMTVGYRFT